ncbi:hypothetical protein Tco_0570171 [Tanacetum coccineum]
MVKSWLVQDQTVPELAIPEQTATGKGIPNPLMAGSFPKTIKPTELDVAVLLKRQVRAGHAAYTDRFHELANDGAKYYAEGCADFCLVCMTVQEERIQVLGPSVPLATPTMHLEGFVAHASTVTAKVELGLVVGILSLGV